MLLVLLFSFLVLLYDTLLILLHRVVGFHSNNLVFLWLLLQVFRRLNHISTFFGRIELSGVDAELLEPLPSFEGPLDLRGSIHLSFNPDREQLVPLIDFPLQPLGLLLKRPLLHPNFVFLALHFVIFDQFLLQKT